MNSGLEEATRGSSALAIAALLTFWIQLASGLDISLEGEAITTAGLTPILAYLFAWLPRRGRPPAAGDSGQA